jgi:trimethylamine--corrinoid protein Co-methyltransferase
MPPALTLPITPIDVLTEDQLAAIDGASWKILEDIGVEFQDAEVLDLWIKAGAEVDLAAGRVRLDRGLVRALIANAPSAFTWRARNPDHDVRIGGGQVAFGPCGGMVYVESEDGHRRPGTLKDYVDFIKVAHDSQVMHFASWEQVTNHDLPVSVRHLHRLRASLLHTDKPASEVAHGRVISADNLAMARLVFGAAMDREVVIGDVINVNSPLRFDGRMLGGLLTYARAGQATYITPFILAGAMSPISIAAALSQQNAEALAGVALTQLVRPGAPVLMGGFTTNADMRSGAPALGTPEGAWSLLAGAQLARHYGLPFRGSGALTTSKVTDAQAAYETAWSLWPCLLGGANLIMHAAGWLESGLTASQTKFAADLDYLETLTLGAPVARSWQARLRAYQPPPLDPALREALDEFVARRERELSGVALYE